MGKTALFREENTHTVTRPYDLNDPAEGYRLLPLHVNNSHAGVRGLWCPSNSRGRI